MVMAPVVFQPLICAGVPAAAIAWRIRVEEKLLDRAYGEDYRLYPSRTRAIVPGIL